MAGCEFGRILDRIAAARGWHAARLARQMGLSPSSLSRLRSGQRAVAADEVGTWAGRLDLAGDERAAFLDAGFIAASPEAVRDRLRAKPVPAAPEPRAPGWHDGRWLTYSRSFSDDGLIQRSLLTIAGDAATLHVREAGRLRYSYHGSSEILGDKVFLRLAEDRGGAEYVQITCDSFFDYQQPTFLSGIVCGISGRDPRHPVSRPAAARILLLHIDAGADRDRIEPLLTTGPDAAMQPFWPAFCGDGGLLRAALRLDLRESLDEAVVRLIDNRIAQPGGVLRSMLS